MADGAAQGGVVVEGVLDDAGFREFVERLAAGRLVVGPHVRDASVVLDEISSADDLPSGFTLHQAPGTCRLEPLEADDRRRFAWAVGPSSPKAWQHPAERVILRAGLVEDGFEVSPPDDAGGPEVALVGVRPCDVAAMGVLRRVLGEATKVQDALVVAVNCAEPGGTCFCASMGTGPMLGAETRLDVDVELWEQPGPDGPRYLVGHVSARARPLLAGLVGDVDDADGALWAAEANRAAVGAMGRELHTESLPENLLAALESKRWDDVASRCLSCGNCTMVCPTCFCFSVHDVADLEGTEVERRSRWDSCFSLDHSYVHGGSVRPRTSDRYRQWLTHKLSTWWGQFGESGCVGCGRCISWCPVGIDIVEEAGALAAEGAAASLDAPAPTAVFLRERGVMA
jgi:ferredoxin